MTPIKAEGGSERLSGCPATSIIRVWDVKGSTPSVLEISNMGLTTWRSRLVLPVSPARDHIRGPVDAPVTLLEYGDYECPNCGEAHPVVTNLLAGMRDPLRFVFRHFPLTTIHPHAENAAEAAEAAGAQGHFWAMHDTLYDNQQALDDAHLVVYAAKLDLDVAWFSRELAAHTHAAKLSEDFMSGVRSGVNGTPCFFINGMRHDGSWDFATLFAAVRHAALVVDA